MRKQTWTAPEFEEVHLGSEGDTPSEDEDDPSFLFLRKTSVRRRGGGLGAADAASPSASPSAAQASVAQASASRAVDDETCA
jgi:hypothetical protein